MDSPLYEDSELENAVQRSGQYYSSIGFPEMTEHYFHHRVSDLKRFDAKKLYHPQSFLLRLKGWLGQTDSPFSWYVIKQGVE